MEASKPPATRKAVFFCGCLIGKSIRAYRAELLHVNCRVEGFHNRVAIINPTLLISTRQKSLLRYAIIRDIAKLRSYRINNIIDIILIRIIVLYVISLLVNIQMDVNSMLMHTLSN